MKTNLNNISQKCRRQNLLQNHIQENVDKFVEHRYFSFQNEIQFSSNTIMEQLKITIQTVFVVAIQFYQVLHHITHMTSLC